MTQIADLTDRLTRLAKRREDEGIYTDAMIASAAADRIAALEAQLAERVKGLEPIFTKYIGAAEKRHGSEKVPCYVIAQHLGEFRDEILSALEATPPAPKVTEDSNQ